MNPITFECPHCHEVNYGDDSMYGQQTTCWKCDAAILIPTKPLGSEPRTARLITDPVADTSRGLDEAIPETEIFAMSPVARAFPGQILVAMILVGAAGVLAFRAEEFSWPRWVAWVPFGVGLFVLLLIWIRVKSYRYRLTTQRLFVRRGFLARNVNELELYRVKDVVVNQRGLQRLLGYGTITVLVDDESTPEVNLSRISSPMKVKETIRTHYRAARQREGVRPTEFMTSP